MDATTFRDVLLERGIGKDVIRQLETDKVDASVIPMMSDTELKRYVPSFGDRIYIVSSCRRINASSIASTSSSASTNIRRDQVLARMQNRFQTAQESRPMNRAPWIGNKSAQKKERRVEVGWMDFDMAQQRYKLVKAVRGGGTRHLTLAKTTTVLEILSIAEDLFFPNGVLDKRKLTSYETEIRSSQVSVTPLDTVEKLYEQSKVKILRLYLHTIPKTEQTTEENIALVGTHNLEAVDVLVESDSEIIIGAAANEEASLDDTVEWTYGLALSSSESESSDPVDPVIYVHPQSHSTPGTVEDTASRILTLTVRRGYALCDLIKEFTNPQILDAEIYISMRLPNGNLERGQGSGVMRDCFTEFWNDFYEQCTLGTDAKVPILRTDYQLPQWQAIARIIVVGWKLNHFFPVKLAVPFLEEILYGSSTSSCKEAFLQYISEKDRQVLISALNNYDSVDLDDVINVLQEYGCRQVVRKENLHDLILNTGHKEIIELPGYIIQKWYPIVSTLQSEIPREGLLAMMRRKIPTASSVQDQLIFPTQQTPRERTICRYLTKYISELDQRSLQLFLRFCTGSNLIGHSITVQFMETTDFLQLPQAHTCACILKLPVRYPCYPEFRWNLNSVLEHSDWSMDII